MAPHLLARSAPLLFGVPLLLLFPACDSTEEDPSATATPPDYVSAVSGSNRDLDDDAPSADDGEENSGDDDTDTREVSEADVFFLDGNFLYILNSYRGLQVLDVSNPDKPYVRGRAPMTGYPVEMYVRDGRAYVVVSDYFTYWRSAEDADVLDSFHGSALAVVDVEDPDHPEVLSRIDLEGYVSQTRAVGDVIYAVSTRYAYYSCDGSDDTEDETYVVSVDIADPTDPHEVEYLSWPGSWAQIHATSKALYVAEPDYNYTEEPKEEGDEATPTSSYVTHLTYIDISDPQGDLEKRGTFDLPGYTWDKFALNEYDGTFRAVTQKWDGVTSGTLTVLDVTNPAELKQLSSIDLVLPQLESVTAARFDGDRGYVVTAEQVDPLFVVDLSNPSKPRLAGQVEMPGQLTHLETLGDRIIAFGQDNAEAGTWRFAVSLFDVSDMDNPSLLDREIIGDGSYSWSAATWDDKAFTILQDQNLIAVPFTAYDNYWSPSEGGVQLLDYSDKELTARGMVTHSGYVYRVRWVNGRLASLSDSSLLMIDAGNRDKPRVTADVALTRYIVDYVPMGGVGVQLELPSWYDMSKQGSLRVVSAENPDEVGDALVELPLDINDGFLIPLSKGLLGLVRTWYVPTEDKEGYYYYGEAQSVLEVFDLTNPTSPAKISSLTLPSPMYSYYYYYGWYGSSYGTMVQTGTTLAWLEQTYYGYPYVDEVDAEEGSGESVPPSTGSGRVAVEEEELPPARLHVIDLADPAAPSLSSLDLDFYEYNLMADGSRLLATHYEQLPGENLGRYYADIFDVSDPAAPEMVSSINIPGYLVSSLDGGRTLVTLEPTWYMTPMGYEEMVYSLRTLQVTNGFAWPLDSIQIPGYVYSLDFEDGVAYLLSQDYYWTQTVNDCGYYESQPLKLQTVSLENPSSLRLASTETLPFSWGSLRGVESGRLFVDGYYQGMLVYDVRPDPLHPTYETFARTSGWVMRVRAKQSAAYLPAGMYGVYTIDF